MLENKLFKLLLIQWKYIIDNFKKHAMLATFVGCGRENEYKKNNYNNVFVATVTSERYRVLV